MNTKTTVLWRVFYPPPPLHCGWVGILLLLVWCHSITWGAVLDVSQNPLTVSMSRVDEPHDWHPGQKVPDWSRGRVPARVPRLHSSTGGAGGLGGPGSCSCSEHPEWGGGKHSWARRGMKDGSTQHFNPWTLSLPSGVRHPEEDCGPEWPWGVSGEEEKGKCPRPLRSRPGSVLRSMSTTENVQYV